ncbi:MAG TPA: hypothetical protein PLL69_03430 [Gemmatimonadales bacterium]|nr:hypothetical protein [Gemmatimonadales bacterium]
MPDRRGFLGLVGAGAALPLLPDLASAETHRPPVSEDWDMSWVDRVTGQHRAVFDAPELSNGLPLLRACLWAGQYREVYGDDTRTSPVLVLRHTAFAYAMDDATWDRFGLAGEFGLELFSGAPASPGNPVRTARSDIPEPFRSLNLEQFQASGGIVLGCNLAFSFEMVPRFQKAGNLTPEAARAEAMTHLLPGVILQPSGFFAVSRAQEVGCQFVPAS